MPRARIRSTPDEDLQYRRQEVRVRGKTLATPVKSADPARLPAGTTPGGGAPCINEMYAGVTKKSLSACKEGWDHAVGRRLGGLQRRFRDPQSDLQVCFIEYKEPSHPTRAETDIMAGLAHAHSDMAPLPMLSGLVERVSNVSVKDGGTQYSPSRRKWERLLRHLAGSIEAIEQLGGKPAMGYVPKYRLYYGELVKLYADSGINAFYFDARGSSPVAVSVFLREFTRELDSAGMLEKSLVYMINPGPGLIARDGPAIPAKDILGFGLGVDCLGERRVRPRRGRGAGRGARRGPGGPSRLFDKRTYHYLWAGGADGIAKSYPGDSSIARSRFASGARPDGRVYNAFNAEQLGLEGARLRDMLAASEPLTGYLSGKAGVDGADIKLLKLAKVRQRR